MAPFRIAIVGLGAIGTSIGLALKQASTDIEIIGHDKDHTRAGAAAKRGAVNRADWNLISACEDAEVIILAMPVSGIADTLKALAPYLTERNIVTDTASVKSPVMAWAAEHLPPAVSFVGGNPIIRRVAHGQEDADPNLFVNAVYCLTPAPSATPQALETVADLVTALGAKPYFLDAAEHDGLIAAVGYLPFILAAILMLRVETSASHRELIRLSGVAFESAIDALGGDISEKRDLCLLGKSNIARWLDAYMESLRDFRELLDRADGEALETTFKTASEARQKWLTGSDEGGIATDYSEFSLRQMLLGSAFRPPKSRK
ncbi:MAG: prephenate dehydrogenase/arogenate dehydrogenase family protein [Chloroflexi bacterium]|nr:prephenate dehydrogenase/arogenate dehydrogenase family protein [Chloroflexota bacterium]